MKLSFNATSKAGGFDQLAKAAPAVAARWAPLYAALGWTWRENKYPPTANEITDTILLLIDHCRKCKRKANQSSTGGITVAYDSDGVYLMFQDEVTAWL